MGELTLAQTNLELQNFWFLARSSGDYDKARWICDQLKPYKDHPSTLVDVRNSLLSQLEHWEKSYQRGTVIENLRLEQLKSKSQLPKPSTSGQKSDIVVSVAPAAIDHVSIFGPPSGNTGGTYTSGDITDRVNAFHSAEYQSKLRANRSHITKIDWLSVSFPNISGEEEGRLLWAALSDFMDSCSISITVRNKGHHGYTDSAALVVQQSSGKTRNVGMLAWSEKQGYFMELSGLGCDYGMKNLDDLYVMINAYGGRISRLDVALDLHSEYCRPRGLTVPKFAKQASDGVFRSSFTPSHVSQSISHSGDWSCFINGDTTTTDYDPSKHAHRGITVYAGTNKSDNQIVFYEKGKQLLGAIPDNAADDLRYMLSIPESSDLYEGASKNISALCEKYDLNPDTCGDRSWVRVERRLRRGSNKKYISPDMLYDPDSAFCHDFDGLTDLFKDYSAYVEQEYSDPQTFRKTSSKRLQVMDMTKRLFYARQSVGNLVHELRDMDYSAEQIVEQLSSECPIEDIVFDLLE